MKKVPQQSIQRKGKPRGSPSEIARGIAEAAGGDIHGARGGEINGAASGDIPRAAGGDIHGAALVDFLVGAPLALLTTLTIFIIISHLWVNTYLKTEAYLLARARLYGNTQSCQAASRLVPQNWVARTLSCQDSSVQIHYQLLKEFTHRRELSGKVEVSL